MIKKIRSRIVHRRGVKSDEDVVHWVMFITWEDAERGIPARKNILKTSFSKGELGI